MTRESSSVTMSFRDWRPTEQTREINQVVDARDFEGLAGYVWLILAANANGDVSMADLERFLADKGASERSAHWLQRRRWMFMRERREQNWKGPRADADGNYKRTMDIIRNRPGLSSRQLVRVLAEYGIKRSRQWVLKHRCDPVPDNLTATYKNQNQTHDTHPPIPTPFGSSDRV